MEDNRTTQQKIDALTAELEKNGRCAEQLAGDLPAVIASIEDDEESLKLTRATLRTFCEMWHRHPPIQTFWQCLMALFEMDATRRALMENIEVGECEKIGEL